ncbi:MAG: AarF/UbiB family protein, partial [Wolbachia pipientis]|nr:AarF/UbiB family protein [Wolbachia pipientis]
NTKNDKGFYVPKVDWSRTSKKVLTLEWIEATPIYEVKKLNNHKQIAINLIESFCNQVYRDCFFHADIHPGNLMVDMNNNIIALDYGIMGRIDRETCYYIIEILKGFLNRNYDHIAKIHFRAGYVSPQQKNFVTACRAIGEPIIGQPIQKISFANLLTQLFKITSDFNMKVQTQLLLLQKTLILLEGTCRKIYPEINMWKVVESWINNQHKNKIDYKEKIKSSRPVKTIQEIFNLVEKLNLIADQKLENIQIKIKSNIKTYLLLWFIIIALIIKILIF